MDARAEDEFARRRRFAADTLEVVRALQADRSAKNGLRLYLIHAEHERALGHTENAARAAARARELRARLTDEAPIGFVTEHVTATPPSVATPPI